MAIANVVTAGFGPSASIAFVVTRGYSIAEVVLISTRHMIDGPINRDMIDDPIDRNMIDSPINRNMKDPGQSQI